MKKEVLRMERVTYKEHNISKLDDFNLHIFEGEIMGILPVTTHGRKSFLRLLDSNPPLEEGYIYYNEQLVNSWKGSLGGHNRITIIQDRSTLVDTLTVADNIFVLRRGFRQEVIFPSVLDKQLQPFLEELNLSLPASTLACNLTAFERLVVELLRGIVARHRLIVLDDITTMIAGADLQKMHEIMRYYAKKGTTFLYIASHLEDIIQVCTHTALLDNGRIEKVIAHPDMQSETLKSVTQPYINLVQAHLEQDALDENTLPDNDNIICKAQFRFKNCASKLQFTVQKGECLVLQCLQNHMYLELTQAALSGTSPAQSFLKIRTGNSFVQPQLCDRTIAVVHEYASKSMIFHHLDYMDNLCFTLDSRMPNVWTQRKIKRSIRSEYTEKLGDAFHIPVEELSEKQKIELIYTRIHLQKPKLVFCIQPFKGADMELRMVIWHMLEDLLKMGIGVVLLVVNLADSLAIADRLLRIEADGHQQEYTRSDFASLPISAPWKDLYEHL